MRSEPKSSTACRDALRGAAGWPASLSPGLAGFARVVRKRILGGLFRFASDSPELMGLVEAAYGGLPSQALPMADVEFEVELRLSANRDRHRGAAPAPPRIHSTASDVSAVMDPSNHVAIEPARRRALVVVSRDMLQHAYHVRYELLEFAVFILATRGVGLVPLHAACVGRDGRGVLLLGDSGAGKSTLVLHGMLQGLEVLAEDAVFVRPENLLATGVPNFLHLRTDALATVDDDVARRWIARAPVIRRRSGVDKFEVDLRHGYGRPATNPFTLVGAVQVSARSAARPDALLSPLAAREFAGLLVAGQRNASVQPGWRQFTQRLRGAGGHRLQRGCHPGDSVDALRRLLD